MSRVFGSPPRAEGDPNNLERQSTSTRLGSVTLCVPLREQRATPRIAGCVPQRVEQCPLQCSSPDCCSPLNYSGQSESPYHYSVFPPHANSLSRRVGEITVAAFFPPELRIALFRWYARTCSVEYLPVCYRYFDCFDSFSGWYGMVVFTSGIDSLIFVRHLIV